MSADAENCRPPANVSGHTIANNIRKLALKYGRVTAFRAYLDISEHGSTNLLRLRSELQSAGVSLIDCPHNGKKDVADQVILGKHRIRILCWQLS
jgi:NYN domain